MSRRWMSLVFLFAAAVGGVACSKKTETTSNTAEEQAKPAATDKATAKATQEDEQSSPDAKPLVPVTRDAKSIPGRYVMVLTEALSDQGIIQDFFVWILEISQAADKSYQAELIANGQVLPKPTIKSVEVNGTTLRLVFESEEQGETNFEGTLQDGVIRGNFVFPPSGIDAARLLPTKADSLDNYAPASLSPGSHELPQIASDQQNPFPAMRKYALEHPEFPLSLKIYEALLANAGQANFKPDELRKLVDEYLQIAGRWGSRMATRARLNAAFALAASETAPDLALELVAAAEKGLTKETENWQPSLDSAREIAKVVRAKQTLADDEKRDQWPAAVELLEQAHEKYSYDPRIAYALAEHAEQQGETEKAINLYGEITALPMLEQSIIQAFANQPGKASPHEQLAKLWIKRHGSTDGLDEFLEKTYREHLDRLTAQLKEKIAPPAEGKSRRTVLCEIFTGTYCQYCVAADIAVDALMRTYPPDEFVPLFYHQHIPGPDPLANRDTEARLTYYGGQGAPVVCIDGRMLQGVGGLMQQVEPVYKGLRSLIDARLTGQGDAADQQDAAQPDETKPDAAKESEAAPPSPIQINLQARAADGKLTITAEATGADEATVGNLRLRLALVEPEIKFLAPIGIRQHYMVVRSMPGGAAGLGPKEGKFSYSETIDLAEWKQKLVDYLKVIESGARQDFPAKPLALQPLQLVGFVQDDKTRLILQVARVSVEGELIYPETKEPAKTDQAPPPPGEAKASTPKAITETAPPPPAN